MFFLCCWSPAFAGIVISVKDFHLCRPVGQAGHAGVGVVGDCGN